MEDDWRALRAAQIGKRTEVLRYTNPHPLLGQKQLEGRVPFSSWLHGGWLSVHYGRKGRVSGVVLWLWWWELVVNLVCILLGQEAEGAVLESQVDVIYKAHPTHFC